MSFIRRSLPIISRSQEVSSNHSSFKEGLGMEKWAKWLMMMVLAFRDIAPQAPMHILIIPKSKDGLTGLSKVQFFFFLMTN
ncbi:14 kDa zinc-binding [Gossypium arboreum]|uniref:14 kDa zinc-binding n=1 Tax=Gossypium arboreum TaxID=29729 RepID=A0A0B0PC10_GOSAR|nr:14 kDa zinc-binding [Gossypium arboreum]